MNYRFDIFNFVGYFVSIRTFFLSFQKSKIEIFIRFLMNVICVTFGRKLTKLVFHFI